MFDTIRNHKKYLMGFLLILIIPGFVLFGVQGFTDFNQRGETVATVDGHDISKGEWDEAHRNEAQRLRDRLGIDQRITHLSGRKRLQQVIVDPAGHEVAVKPDVVDPDPSGSLALAAGADPKRDFRTDRSVELRPLDVPSRLLFAVDVDF